MIVDIVVGLQYGDEAKKKICNWLLRNKHYDWSCRFGGGPNCGGTLYHNGKKYVLHHLPNGLLHGVKSLIGSGCVIHPKILLGEIEQLERDGIPAAKLLYISENAHVITDEHIDEDRKKDKIGSTGRGIMPVYRDKSARKGIRAKDCPELQRFICNQYEKLYQNENNVILLEGNQGLFLDLDHTPNYPYCTSSYTTSTYALHSLGLPLQSVRDVYGAAKAYETYVGKMNFQPKDDIFSKIQEIGNEFGATTGRPRQVNWMDIDLLNKAAKINGVTKVIINKTDVLQKIDKWFLYENKEKFDARTEEAFKDFVTNFLNYEMKNKVEVVFSYSPEEI